MRLLARLRAAARRLLRRSAAERELDAELDAYLGELTDEYRRRGLGPEDAHRAALLDLGGIDRVKESVRAAWTAEWAHTLWRDVRFSLRSFRGRPAFAAVTVSTLALGIGGATAVFSVVDAVLVRPPAGIEDARRVVAVNRLVNGAMRDGLSYPELVGLQTGAPMLESVAGHVGAPMRLRTAGGVRTNVIVDFVTGSYFGLLGVRPALGRLLGETDTTLGDPRAVLVLSHRAWRQRFGSDSDVVGRVVELTGTSFTIVGVAPEGFEGTMTGQQVEGWAPLPMIEARGVPPSFATDRSLRLLSVLGRLRPGASVEGARDALAPRELVVERDFGRYPELREADERFFRVVGTAVVLLLLLACANVASLLLLRASARRHELAARLALGASRPSLARRLVVESTLLVGAATVLGAAGADLLVGRTRLLAPLVMGELAYGIDGRVLAFATLVAMATVLLVSALPVLRLGRVAPMAVLRVAAARAGGPMSIAPRGLVVAQVAVSFALVATAGTILEDVRQLVRGDQGFDTRDLAMVYFDIRTHGYGKERMDAVVQALGAAAAEVPSIEASTVATAAPLLGRGRSATLYADGATPRRAQEDAESDTSGLRVRHAAIQPSYFGVLGVPVQEGRPFGADDRAGAEDVAIVTRALAMSLWGGGSVVGRHVQLARQPGGPLGRLRVVGVVADHKHGSILESEPPVLYVPLAQAPVDGLLLIARGRRGPPLDALRELLGEVDPELYADGEWTTDELVGNWTASQRTASLSVGLFGILAILLSSLGVYGTVGHVVSARLRELAVRSALGAAPGRLTMLAMREGCLLAATGLLVGGLLSTWTQALARRSLDGVGGPDALVALACAAGVAVAMMGSSYAPTRRLRRADLVDVLRRE